MKENKLETITKLFEGNQIRSIWDNDKEDYYFSVVDVISALTESANPRNYWNMLKKRMTEEEKSELSTKCVQLKMKSKKDGKFYNTDTLDTKGILRLIESVPSPKAEPFKMWLASLGKERIDQTFDPSKGIDKMIDFYLSKGYTLEWIEARIKGIINRKKLTNVWSENGITEGREYAILTNEIYKGWADMSAKEYKPFGLEANRKIAKAGGSVAKNTRNNIESLLGKSIVSDENSLSYRYNDNKQIENK